MTQSRHWPLARVRLSDVREYSAWTSGWSVRLGARKFDYRSPLLGFLGDEFAEIGRREGKLSATFVRKPRLYFGIGESGVDFPIKRIDDLGRRILGRANAEPGTCLVARHELAHGRDV